MGDYFFTFLFAAFAVLQVLLAGIAIGLLIGGL